MWLRRILLSIFSALFILSCDAAENNNDKTADIALYSDNGAWNKSVIAAKNMYEWMGYRVAIIDAEYINTNSPGGFKIVSFPGGDMYRYSQDILESGKEKIRDFIRNGGKYIGLCAGGFFTSEKLYWQGSRLIMSSLSLFEGTARGPNNEIIAYPWYGMCDVKLDTTQVIARGMSASLSVLYYRCPCFEPEGDEIFQPGTYSAINKAAMLVFEYGSGRVFATGAHPEIEEDNDRDGVVFADTTINGTYYPGEENINDSGSRLAIDEKCGFVVFRGIELMRIAEQIRNVISSLIIFYYESQEELSPHRTVKNVSIKIISTVRLF